MDGDSIVLRGPATEAAPATADVEQFLAGLEAQLAADEVQLAGLGVLQRLGCVRVVCAGVDHLRIQEEAVEVVADIIVEGDEVLVLAGGLVLTLAGLAGGVVGGVADGAGRAGQKEGNQLACDQSLVHALRQVDGAAVVPAVGGLQRRAALDAHVAGGVELEQGHQAGLQHQTAHGGRVGQDDADVVAGVRAQGNDLARPQLERQVGLQVFGYM